MTRRLNNDGFTLIELLAVLAVIAILSAILIPAISKVRESARASQCVSNLRQVGMTILSYAVDHDNSLPNKSEPNKSLFVSHELMDPYLDYDDPTWICPIMSESQQAGLSSGDQGRYIYSWRLTNFNDGWRDTVDAIKINTVVNPSDAMVAANLSTGMRGGYWDGLASVLFVDGSVRRVSDPSYLGGNVTAIDGIYKRYMQTTGGKLRGYDY
ncbi:type II secretion system protein [Coraliomargarita parva]|uniref:type II secretion system protein n=1 Tax=Coraliomargarita parva TaxID=3014050 RepID=UPI0022B5B04A|nr:type II secretion system protein [Coraliomargarita parva]